MGAVCSSGFQRWSLPRSTKTPINFSIFNANYSHSASISIREKQCQNKSVSVSTRGSRLSKFGGESVGDAVTHGRCGSMRCTILSNSAKRPQTPQGQFKSFLWVNLKKINKLAYKHTYDSHNLSQRIPSMNYKYFKWSYH